MNRITFFTTAALVVTTIDLHAQQMGIHELFKLVSENSKKIIVKKSEIAITDEGIKIAKDQKLPDVDVQLSFSFLGNGIITDRDFSNYTKAAIPHLGNDFALEASQAIYSGGAITSSIRLAELAKRQTETSSESLRQQLCFIALGQYLQLFKIDNQMTVYQNNILLTQRLVEQVKAKQRQGLVLKNDITRYELLLENQKLILSKLNDNRKILNHQLCTTIGKDKMTINPDTTIVSTIYAKEGEHHWQEDASQSSTLLKLSSINIDIAHQQSKLTASERLPKIALIAADHFDGPITIEVPPINKNFNYWYIGVGIKYNLSSIFKSGERIRQASINLQKSKEEHQVNIDKIENDIQEAYTYYLQSYVELETQQKSVQLAQQNYDVISNRYLNQLALVTDMVDAENVKLSAELQEVNAKIGIVYAYYKMRYTAGTI